MNCPVRRLGLQGDYFSAAVAQSRAIWRDRDGLLTGPYHK
jgi:hypothetical protein